MLKKKPIVKLCTDVYRDVEDFFSTLIAKKIFLQVY